MTRRTHSFVWSGIIAALIIALGIFLSVSGKNFTLFPIFIGVGVAGFTFSSCLILKNNFIGDVVLEIFSWGFVQLPGLIFTMDLDGLIWLLTVKLIFWILGFILAFICGVLAIVIGCVLSIFVYPFAIYKNFKAPEDVNL